MPVDPARLKPLRSLILIKLLRVGIVCRLANRLYSSNQPPQALLSRAEWE